MKIGHPAENTVKAPAIQGTATVATDAAKSTATPSAIPTTADPSARIALSTGATDLLAGHGSADFDAEKVARISQQIENKTFKINPEAIADKLISNARELLTKT